MWSKSQTLRTSYFETLTGNHSRRRCEVRKSSITIRSLYLLLASFALSETAPAALQEAPKWKLILPSIHAVQVDQVRKVVRYLPGRPAFVDATGRESAPQVIAAGSGGLIISGRLSFVADASDLKMLKEGVAEQLGAEYSTELLTPSRFGVLINYKEQTVWSRPYAGGEFGNMPVQFALKIVDTTSGVSLKVGSVISWDEKAPPVGISVKLDWTSIKKLFDEKYKVGEIIPEKGACDLIESAVSTPVVEVTTTSGEPFASSDKAKVMSRVKEAVITQLSDTYLIPYPSSAEQGEGSIYYKVRGDMQVASGTSTINLSSSTAITRSVVVTGVLAIWH
jgi:hypothetical protein